MRHVKCHSLKEIRVPNRPRPEQEDIFRNELRFEYYQTQTVKSCFIIGKLPPTEVATAQYCYRVYFQFQTWLGNKLTEIGWRWEKHIDGIKQKFSHEKCIPNNLLKTICIYKRGWRNHVCTNCTKPSVIQRKSKNQEFLVLL